jgi:hypothetical protein
MHAIPDTFRSIGITLATAAKHNTRNEGSPKTLYPPAVPCTLLAVALPTAAAPPGVKTRYWAICVLNVSSRARLRSVCNAYWVS